MFNVRCWMFDGHWNPPHPVAFGDHPLPAGEGARRAGHRSTRVALFLLLATLLMAPGWAQATPSQDEQSWTLTTSDFATRRVRLASLADQAAQTIEPDGQRGEVAPQQLVRLERIGHSAAPAGDAPFVLHLRSGDRLFGNPVRLTETALVMQSALLGDVEIPLEQLAALARASEERDAAWRLSAPAADEILLANGDLMTGYLSAVDAETWTFADERGNESPLPADSVRQVRFADPGVAAERAGEGWRVRLIDGSLLTVSEVALADAEFALTYRGAQARQPETSVAWLEPVDGPVRWLADLPMAEAVHTPYLGASFPSIAEPSGHGARSFTVRSRSHLSFDIPQGYARLRTRYAMDRNMTQGSVDVRILLDGKVVHEHKALTAADTPEPVEVPLEGAARLTLEVDYGPGLDVQDVLHWIDPALVK